MPYLSSLCMQIKFFWSQVFFLQTLGSLTTGSFYRKIQNLIARTVQEQETWMIQLDSGAHGVAMNNKNVLRIAEKLPKCSVAVELDT